MKKGVKRLLCVILTITMIITLVPESNARAANKWTTGTESEFHVQKKDGDYLYKMQVSENGLSFQIDMTNTDTGESTLIVYDNGVASTYNTTPNDTTNTETTEPISVVDYRNSISVAETILNDASVKGYRSMTICVIPTLAGNNLWYQMGSTSPDVGYMKMGCDWTYRVKADACADCTTFRNKIVESNNLVAKSGLTAASAVAVGVAILAAGPVGGLSAALAMGITGTAALNMVDAAFAEQAAHESYDIAKGYGVVISKN